MNQGTIPSTKKKKTQQGYNKKEIKTLIRTRNISYYYKQYLYQTNHNKHIQIGIINKDKKRNTYFFPAETGPNARIDITIFKQCFYNVKCDNFG